MDSADNSFDLKSICAKGFDHVSDWDSLALLLPRNVSIDLSNTPELKDRFKHINFDIKEPSFCQTAFKPVLPCYEEVSRDLDVYLAQVDTELLKTDEDIHNIFSTLPSMYGQDVQNVSTESFCKNKQLFSTVKEPSSAENSFDLKSICAKGFDHVSDWDSLALLLPRNVSTDLSNTPELKDRFKYIDFDIKEPSFCQTAFKPVLPCYEEVSRDLDVYLAQVDMELLKTDEDIHNIFSTLPSMYGQDVQNVSTESFCKKKKKTSKDAFRPPLKKQKVGRPRKNPNPFDEVIKSDNQKLLDDNKFYQKKIVKKRCRSLNVTSEDAFRPPLKKLKAGDKLLSAFKVASFTFDEEKDIVDMSPSAQNEQENKEWCKEKMRPVKKVLKALDDLEEKKNELRYGNYMQECLIEIGSHISKCLEEYKYKIREWKSNLWFFVSKFTEFGSKILLKIYRRGLHTIEKFEKNNKVKDRNKNRNKVRNKSKEDKKLQQNMELEVSLTSLKRKSRDSDDDELEKINKKQKTTNNNPGFLLTTPNSIPTTPPSFSNSSNVTRSYDQNSNRYDTNYKHHRNRGTPYYRSDNRSDTRNDNRRFLSSRNSNSRRERYDNSYRSSPAFREIEREIDSICERMTKLDINSEPMLHMDELQQLVSMLLNCNLYSRSCSASCMSFT